MNKIMENSECIEISIQKTPILIEGSSIEVNENIPSSAGENHDNNATMMLFPQTPLVYNQPSEPSSGSSNVEIVVNSSLDEIGTCEHQPNAAVSHSEDEEESARLAWQLQREEENNLLRMQLEELELQKEAGLISQEDMEALRALLTEGSQMTQMIQAQISLTTNPAEIGPPRRRRIRPQVIGSNNIERTDVSVLNPNDEDGEGEEDDNINQDEANAENDVDEEEDEEEEEDLSYDQLLHIGQVLGDVKTERWRLRAQDVINSLQCFTYGQLSKPLNKSLPPHPPSINESDKTPFTAVSYSQASTDGLNQISSNNNKKLRMTPTLPTSTPVETQSQERCVVCMEYYTDEDIVKVLPTCKHFFHEACTAGWLAVSYIAVLYLHSTL